eukprot:7343477-Alexandrium_andersonii.AAC.1
MSAQQARLRREVERVGTLPDATKACPTLRRRCMQEHRARARYAPFATQDVSRKAVEVRLQRLGVHLN